MIKKMPWQILLIAGLGIGIVLALLIGNNHSTASGLLPPPTLTTTETSAQTNEG